MSPSPAILTASEFAVQKPELPEAGRWHELHEGRLALLSAPDDHHGTVVLNISRALATWFQTQKTRVRGYACPELGIHVSSDPDTVYVPALSIFFDGTPFSQFDRAVASEVPKLVIDVASSNDRRSEMRRRTTAYLQHGVEVIWIPDPFKKEVQVIRRAAHTLAPGKWQMLEGGSVLPGFQLPVEHVFAEPGWWNGDMPEFDIIRE